MIGAGFIGQLGHLMNYCEVHDCEVIALAEYRPELRQKVMQRYSIPRGYSSHRELLQDSDVEAVVVVTPRPYTGPVILDCLNAGKHVISEKPMAGTTEQAQRLLDAAKNKGVRYMVGYMKRYDEGVQAAKQIVDQLLNSHELGTIQFVRAHCYMGDSYCKADGHVITDERAEYKDAGWLTAPEWLPDELRSLYASFVNNYSHNTNLLRFLFNRIPKVEYVNLSRNPGQLAVLDFSDFICTLETGRSSNRGWDEVTEIFFADGRLSIYTPPALLKNVPAKVELYKAGKVQEIISPQCNWTWAFRRQAQAFVTDVLENKPTLISAEDAIEDLKLIEAMWKKELELRQETWSRPQSLVQAAI